MQKNHGLHLALMALATSFSVASAEAPAEVVNLQAEAGTDFIDLTWDEGVAADGTIIQGYKVYYGTEPGQMPDSDGYSQVVDVSFNSYTLRNLDEGETYYVAITALCDLPDCESLTFSPEVAVPLSADVTEPAAEVIPPFLLGATHDSAEMVTVTFSEEVTLQDGADNFFLESRTTGTKVRIMDMEIEGKKAILTLQAGALSSGDRYSITATQTVANAAGTAVVQGNKDSIRFTAREFAPEVVVEPVVEEPEVIEEEPVELPSSPPIVTISSPTNLNVDMAKLTVDATVQLSWAAANGANIVDQALYIKEDQNDWEPAVYVGKGTEVVDIEVGLDKSYLMKIVSVDEAANESDSVEISFGTPSVDVFDEMPVEKVMPPAAVMPLPESGASTSLYLLLAMLVGAGMFTAARRER